MQGEVGPECAEVIRGGHLPVRRWDRALTAGGGGTPPPVVPPLLKGQAQSYSEGRREARERKMPEHQGSPGAPSLRSNSQEPCGLGPVTHLLAFGVAGGGVGVGVVLPLKRALQGLQVVLAEGVRAEVLPGPAAAALRVDA